MNIVMNVSLLLETWPDLTFTSFC